MGAKQVIKETFAAASKEIRKAVAWVKDPKKRAQGAAVLASSINLIEQALPIVKAIAAFTPAAGAAAVLLPAVEKTGLQLEAVLKETDWHRQVGMLEDLAGEALRAKLKELLPKAKGGLELFGKVIRSAEELDQISSHLLQTPVKLAYSIARASGEVISVIEANQPPK